VLTYRHDDVAVISYCTSLNALACTVADVNAELDEHPERLRVRAVLFSVIGGALTLDHEHFSEIAWGRPGQGAASLPRSDRQGGSGIVDRPGD
jgi:hypothetical protein